jgi:hypothetical protein
MIDGTAVLQKSSRTGFLLGNPLMTDLAPLSLLEQVGPALLLLLPG